HLPNYNYTGEDLYHAIRSDTLIFKDEYRENYIGDKYYFGKESKILLNNYLDRIGGGDDEFKEMYKIFINKLY
ncbi:unnamed protein product, partial [marine sediment metagenome]